MASAQASFPALTLCCDYSHMVNQIKELNWSVQKLTWLKKRGKDLSPVISQLPGTPDLAHGKWGKEMQQQDRLPSAVLIYGQRNQAQMTAPSWCLGGTTRVQFTLPSTRPRCGHSSRSYTAGSLQEGYSRQLPAHTELPGYLIGVSCS